MDYLSIYLDNEYSGTKFIHVQVLTMQIQHASNYNLKTGFVLMFQAQSFFEDTMNAFKVKMKEIGNPAVLWI